MTERPLSISTQIATPIQTPYNSTASISATDALSALPSADLVEEEPYTIKCICDYYDDDGNTIYCEKCDTWQHIECFYPGRVEEASKEEFDHSCADCRPQPLDRRTATERQRNQRQNKLSNDSGDKKIKRPPSKSHKKKTKPSDSQVNGFDHEGRNGSPHEPQPKKKGHRSTQSVSSLVKRSPPYHSRPNSHNRPPSPAHTPPDLPKDFEVHGYSHDFITLCDDERTVPETGTNSFASLEVTNSLSLWLQNPEKLEQDTGKKDKNQVLQYLKSDPSTLTWPRLSIERKEILHNDAILSCKYVATHQRVHPSFPVGELSGMVGFQKDYCDNPDNRWNELVHPRPFVFFLPHIPLYIDTRSEGSICRYVRRSCRPNTILETYIASGSEYHFWLIPESERAISENEQITISWDFRFPAEHNARFLYLLNLSDPDTPSNGAHITDEEYEQLANVTNLVLSDYGGCACDLGHNCAFARFHRNYYGRVHARSNGVKKKGRKPKQNHASPTTSTGHATNSRAASEGQQEPFDDDDVRSLSGSTRSKPHSRDLTPLNGTAETNGILTEPSDREKRKLAAVEDSFRKMEQGQPPRKKKRASEGSTMNAPSSTTTTQPNPKPRQRSVVARPAQGSTPAGVNGSKTRHYVDAGTSRRQSGSPFSAVSPRNAPPSPGRPNSRSESLPGRSRRPSNEPKNSYTDSSTQTEAEENAWYTCPASSSPKRPIVSLSMRLLKNRHRINKQLEARRSVSGEGHICTSPTVSMEVDSMPNDDRSNPGSPVDSKDRNASIASSTTSVDASAAATDVTMTDVPTSMVGNTIKPPPPPWPGHSNAGSGSSHPQKSPDLRVQLPPTPSFTIPSMSGPFSGSNTPSSAAASATQSPFGTTHFPSTFVPMTNGLGQHPSPAKATKKLSLSDYRAARAKKDTSTISKQSTGNSPTLAPTTLKPSLSVIEETKGLGILEGSPTIDTPMTDTPLSEKVVDPMPRSATPSSEVASKNNLPTEQPNGTV